MDQFEAVKTRNLKWFQDKIRQNALPNLREVDNFGQCVPIYAYSFGFLEILKTLLEAHLEDTSSLITDNLCHGFRVAAQNGHLPIVQYLLEDCSFREAIDVSAYDNYAVQHAAMNGHLEVVKYLFEDAPKTCQLSTEVSSFDGIALAECSLFVILAKHGHLDVLKYLLEDCPQKDIFDVPDLHSELLPAALQNGHLEIVKYLLEDCSTESQIALTTHSTVLCWAVESKHFEAIKYLLEDAPQNSEFQKALCENNIFFDVVGNGSLELLEYCLSIREQQTSKFQTAEVFHILQVLSQKSHMSLAKDVFVKYLPCLTQESIVDLAFSSSVCKSFASSGDFESSQMLFSLGLFAQALDTETWNAALELILNSVNVSTEHFTKTLNKLEVIPLAVLQQLSFSEDGLQQLDHCSVQNSVAKASSISI